MTSQEHNDTLRELASAVDQLCLSMDPRLVPPGGAGIGYAVSGARDDTGIAAVKGGIREINGKISAPGPCMFGCGDPLTPAILTAMKFNPAIRSAAVLRFSEPLLGALDDMLLEYCAFDPGREPPGITTMDWGVASCCRDGVPDGIYNRGTAKKEPLLRLFAEKPAGVANNIIMLSNRIICIEL